MSAAGLTECDDGDVGVDVGDREPAIGEIALRREARTEHRVDVTLGKVGGDLLLRGGAEDGVSGPSSCGWWTGVGGKGCAAAGGVTSHVVDSS